MEITGQKLSWMLDKDIYGTIDLATLSLYVKNWQSESGPMDYTHPINIVWNDEEITNLPIFKTDSQTVTITVNRDNNIFSIVVKINGEIVLQEKRELQEKEYTPESSQSDEEIYS